MKTFKLFFLIAISVLIAACSTPPVYITKDRAVPITIPDNLLTKCFVTKPPAVKTYIAGTVNEKEDMLTVYSVSLIKDLKNCNDQISSIKEYQDRQVIIIKNSEAK